MNQSVLIEKVARTAELSQAAAGQAVKAVVSVILESLAAGEAVRVSGLGTFNVAALPAREGRNPRNGETIKIAASKTVRFHAGKAVKDALNPPKGAPLKRSAVRK
jgi:DNA-binding protein HU-beta